MFPCILLESVFEVLKLRTGNIRKTYILKTWKKPKYDSNEYYGVIKKFFIVANYLKIRLLWDNFQASVYFSVYSVVTKILPRFFGLSRLFYDFEYLRLSINCLIIACSMKYYSGSYLGFLFEIWGRESVPRDYFFSISDSVIVMPNCELSPHHMTDSKPSLCPKEIGRKSDFYIHPIVNSKCKSILT